MASDEEKKKAWLLTATLQNWRIGEQRGVFGVHGNRSSLSKIRKGDQYVAFVPRVGFVGYGTITGEHFVSTIRLWKDKPYNHRFQISTPILSTRVLPTASIIDDLSFVTDKKHWGVFFKAGIREIPIADQGLITKGLAKSVSILSDISEDIETNHSTTEIGSELHNRVARLFEDLGFTILHNNYHSAGPDITVVDPQSVGKNKIIIQCKNSKTPERSTFPHLDKHLNEYAGRLKSGDAQAAIIVVSGHNLPKKVPGESGELSIDDILEKYGVAVWTDETLGYYEGLIDKISRFARYQVLSDLGLKVDFDKPVKVDAIKIVQNGYTMYAASLEPDWLLKSVSVVRRIRAADGPKGYQRLLNKNRVKKSDNRESISNYLDTTPEWIFPNAIVLASSSNSELVYEESKLELESSYGQFWVIDGQHRLFAFSNADARKSNNKLLCVIVDSRTLGTVQKSDRELAQIFVTLNGRGKRVPKALLYELYELLGSEDDQSLEVVLKLVKESFFEDCVRGYSDTGGSINLVAFADAKGTESIYKFFRESHPQKDKEEVVDLAAKFILDSFGKLAELFPTEWNDPDTYFLKTDRGVKGILELLSKILAKYGHRSVEISRVLQALKDSEYDFSSETAKGLYLGAGGPDRLARSFSKRINEKIVDFAPEYSSRHAVIPSHLSKKGEIPDSFLKEWIGHLEGEVRCLMNFIDISTVKYLSYLDPSKVSRVRMFFGNCLDNEKKVKESMGRLRENGLNITLTQSQKKTTQRGSFFHGRWIGDSKIQIRTEVDLKDDSQRGSTFHISVDAWIDSPELEDFDRYWAAAEMNKEVHFGYDWGNLEEI
ncbi:MAG: DGQHR domain-containing protein [bacterium]|nr:DGQHR domain-containing protein [bacterium]